jgi:hypothetical protein
MDFNLNWPGEKLVIKLWETLTDKGIGSLLKPVQIKREGRAIAEVQAESMRIIAQAERDVQEIKLGGKIYIEGKLLPSHIAESEVNSSYQPTKIEPYIDQNNLAQLVINNGIKEAVRKEINVSKALLVAEATLAGDSQEPSKEQVNTDWLYRWRDYAGDVSIEELQSLWGKLLAGEVKSPGKYSLRTLEFLRSISKEDANKISLLANYIFEGIIYRMNAEFLNSKGITFDFLLDMQELGIISGIESSGILSTYSNNYENTFYANLKYHNKAVLVSHESEHKKLTLKGYPVTNLGMQVISLGDFKHDESYLEIIANDIKGQGFAVEMADIVVINENVIKYTNKKTL